MTFHLASEVADVLGPHWRRERLRKYQWSRSPEQATTEEARMEDQNIIAKISQLAAQEQQLEEAHVAKSLRGGPRRAAPDRGHPRPLVDLLRQRRALRDAGRSPDAAAERGSRRSRNTSSSCEQLPAKDRARARARARSVAGDGGAR